MHNTTKQISFTTEESEIFKLVSDAAEALQFPCYVVGGFVRDKILNRDTKDIDFVCVGNGLELAKAVAEKIGNPDHVAYFKNFGTAMIKKGSLDLEFVGARKESYQEDSRKPIVENGSLEDDQWRRDFSINAMAISLNKDSFGELLDPFDGIGDLERQIIKTPAEPERTFSDDPLRMMRAIRFATQLGFKIDPVTMQGIKEQRKRISIISAERISTELNKMILSDKPSYGFRLLDESGLLPLIFPEMSKLKGVEVIDGIGHKDNFYHTIEVLDRLSVNSDSLWLRWAAILHDIAKPPTKRFHPKMGWTFHGHEVVGARWVKNIFKRFRLPLDHKMKYVQKMVRLHLRPIGLTKDEITDSAVRRLLFDAGEDIDDLMILCRADITSKNEKKVERYLHNYEVLKEKLIAVEAKDKLRNWQPPITGELIMETFNIPPSKTVGVIKTAIREAILDGDIENDYDAAYAYMLTKAEELNLSS